MDWAYFYFALLGDWFMFVRDRIGEPTFAIEHLYAFGFS